MEFLQGEPLDQRPVRDEKLPLREVLRVARAIAEGLAALHPPPPPVQLNARVPQELSDLVMSLLEKDVSRRPASAGIVAEMLHTLERKLARKEEGHDDTVALRREPSGVAGGKARRGWLLL